MSLSHPIVVRVKRRRDQEPVDSLCIVEDDSIDQNDSQSKKRAAYETNKISNMLSGLSTENNEKKSTIRGQILLTRIGTTTQSTKAFLSQSSSSEMEITSDTGFNTVEPSSEGKVNNFYTSDAKSSHWITKGKKLLRVENSSETVIVVDIHQQANMTNNPDHSSNNSDMFASLESESSASSTLVQSTRVKVFDPASRMMDEAIDKAWRVGDFNGIGNALIRGASADFQRDAVKHQGITALMAAVKHGNIRMVTRLLDKGANVLTKDSNGKTALDILQGVRIPDTKREAYTEINIALHKAVTKQYSLSRANKLANDAQNDLLKGITDDQYVYDIFRYQTTSGSKRTRSDIEDTVPSTNPLSIGQPDQIQYLLSNRIPVIPVEGIHISNDGNVDLVFAYDSDWSDLGDDEDPDSNDERFAGNDYPDEDEGDDESVNGIIDKAGSDAEETDDDEETYKFRRSQIGRVNKHVVVGGGDVEALTARDTETLQRMWGEDGEEDEDNESDIASDFNIKHEERLKGMQKATGMEFASNPREFDRNGLPKYGHDLSDDDNDIYEYEDSTDLLRHAQSLYARRNGNKQIGTSIGGYQSRYVTSKPPRDTIAYDSDYDNEDD